MPESMTWQINVCLRKPLKCTILLACCFSWDCRFISASVCVSLAFFLVIIYSFYFSWFLSILFLKVFIYARNICFSMHCTWSLFILIEWLEKVLIALYEMSWYYFFLILHAFKMCIFRMQVYGRDSYCELNVAWSQ